MALYSKYEIKNEIGWMPRGNWTRKKKKSNTASAHLNSSSTITPTSIYATGASVTITLFLYPQRLVHMSHSVQADSGS